MTRRAVLKPRVQHVMVAALERQSIVRAAEAAGSVMTLETQCKDHRTAEQFGIGRAVRDVTGLAAIDAHTGMFEDEWPAFVGVTSYAGFFIAQPLIDQLRTRTHPPSRGKGS